MIFAIQVGTLIWLTLTGGYAVQPPPISPVCKYTNGADALTFESDLLYRLFHAFALEVRKPTHTKTLDSTITTYFEMDEPLELPRIKMSTTPNRHVTHIGFDLFSPETKTVIRPLGDFFERYFLKLYTVPIAERPAYIAADGLRIEINGIRYDERRLIDMPHLLTMLKTPGTLTVEKKREQFFFVYRDNDLNQVMIGLPARRDLIQGKDKKELDREISDALYRLASETQPAAVSSGSAPVQLIFYGNLLYSSLEPDLFPGMRARTYYLETDDGLQQVRDIKFPLESLANALLRPAANIRVSLKLTHETYDQSRRHDNLDLFRLLGFMSTDRQAYVGFEFSEEGSLKSTQIFKGTEFDTIHVLSIDWPGALLWASDLQNLQATLYTNIRLDNVTELNGRYIEKLNGSKFHIEVERNP